MEARSRPPRSPRRGLHVVALLDAEVSLSALAARRGRVERWFDAFVLDALREIGHRVTPLRLEPDVRRFADRLLAAKPDLVFNLALRAQGDDDKEPHVAALLDLLGVPYTGTSARGLTIGSDKALTKLLAGRAGVAVPRFELRRRGDAGPISLRYPVIVKPATLSGSVGVTRSSVVRRPAALAARVRRVHEVYRTDAICEELVAGRELSVALVGNGAPEVLPILEWTFPPRSPGILTARLKWNARYAEAQGVTCGLARLTRTETAAVRAAARGAFAALEMRDYGRLELRLTSEGVPVLLDANANSGLRPAPTAEGWPPFVALIRKIVRAALART